MLRLGIACVAVILIAGLVAPHLGPWLNSTPAHFDSRRRIELESLIENELDLFCMRHGLEQRKRTS